MHTHLWRETSKVYFLLIMMDTAAEEDKDPDIELFVKVGRFVFGVVVLFWLCTSTESNFHFCTVSHPFCLFTVLFYYYYYYYFGA